MTKRIVWLLCAVLTLFLLLKPPSHFQANGMDQKTESQFIKALEEQLRGSEHYYHQNSARIVDGLTFQGTVLKVLKTDVPETEENEEVIEENTANLVVAFVKLEHLRDELFVFNKTEFYYYNLDNGEFLTLSNVYGNDEVKSFFDTYKNDIKKKLSLSSEILLLILISSLIIVPLLIMIFHNKGRSTRVNIYEYE
ncbi:hypothetical protein [Bacillus sp. S/N-304-OC-R1]|uniref:hypothetical protein n=1 Tax=Bacillus sp. S/N-304-OC-R1 TaxID=2758034 RepID=UPI001C8DAB8F|nr:hypothetical protein [Bacillus sp. S/N-304-OC-R1]MBY0124288.1 hypothetical protein [Bacillus sp. S/N-304-OC-R1]